MVPTMPRRQDTSHRNCAKSAPLRRHGLRLPWGVGTVQLLGTSGTITTLASVQLGLPGYDRRRVDGCAVGNNELSALCRSIGLRSVADRARIACVGPDRAELIVAGCAILEAILTRWPGGDVKVADRGIREGILRTLMTRDGVWMPR